MKDLYLLSNIPTKSNIANDIVSNVVSGFAFGTGSSIARNAIDNMFKQKPESKPESSLHTEYLECLKHNNEDTCKIFFPWIYDKIELFCRTRTTKTNNKIKICLS